MEMLQKYYRNITFILNLIIYIDFFIKKDKILKELKLYCRKKREGKKYKYYLLHFAKYNIGANKKTKENKMSSCLGLYIESNVIKYAKVTKDRELLKIESFGVKFYDKIGEAIDQIVSETFSYNIPISVNLSEEIYNYFYMFSLLNKNDLKKAIDTEFESYCYDKKLNRNAFETRFAISNEIDDKDKVKVIHVSTNKSSITKSLQTLNEHKVSTLTPIGTSIANIASIKPKENIIIVNLEETTTITTIVNQKIYNIEKMQEGSGEILDKIASKENSYSKAYEICKNSTIYTMEGKELQDEENEYLDYIMPTLYKIANRLQDYVVNSTIKFEKIYITGTMSVVNNIDLYFQEFFQTEKVEILKPYFVSENIKINIKDYIEVNSAIAVAMQGLGYGIKNMNFKKPSLMDQLPDWMKVDISLGKKENKPKKENKFKFDFSLKGKLTATEKWLLRGAAGVFMLVILYSACSIYLDNRITEKIQEAEETSLYTDIQIERADQDIDKVSKKASTYREMITNLQDITDKVKDDESLKGSIPTLLMQIMTVTPQAVQITEIKNTADAEGRKIVISAQSKYYDDLGYFKAKIREDGILNNVVSTQGEKQGDFVKIIIEGDLP